jgi:prephenate dehydrogenase
VTLTDQDSHVCIVGCGLIGGSFALALRRAGYQGRITGWDHEAVTALAVERGVIDAPEQSFELGVQSTADLFFLAAPIGGIISFLHARSRLIKPGALVTDAGSTKMEICQVAARHLPAGVDFIGGHPMAGSEHSGVEYARADLFDRATWALVPGHDPQSPHLATLTGLLEALGARTLLMTAADHDRAVALVSHLPQLLASTLATLLIPSASSTPDEALPRIELAQKMAAGGWRDMTRLAASSFSIWRDIIKTNQPSIRESLHQLINQLQQVEEALDRKDYHQLRELFDEANRSVKLLREVRYRNFDKV